MTAVKPGASDLRSVGGLPVLNVEEALARRLPEIDALPATKLSRINVVLPDACSIVLGNLPRLLLLRPRMAKLGDEFDLRNLDSLHEYAMAVLGLSAAYAPRAPEQLDPALIEEAKKLRHKLLGWAVPLAEEGLLPAEVVAKIRAGRGRVDLFGDLVRLGGMFHASWARIEGLPGLTRAHVDRAWSLGMQLNVGHFNLLLGPETPDEQLLRLKRAWTLLDRAYDQCRRAAAFLCHDTRDAERYAPSLRRNRGPAGRKRAGAPAAAATAEVTSSPAAAAADTTPRP